MCLHLKSVRGGRSVQSWGPLQRGPAPSQLKLGLWLCEEQYISWPECTGRTVGVRKVREVGNGEAIRGLKEL